MDGGSLTFTGAELDRAPDRRGDPDWLAGVRERADARALVMSLLISQAARD